jgi:cytidylate kinase
MIITIDGPSGSGKTTIAKGVASRLNFAYLDTGALYRAIAYTLLSEGVDIDDTDAVEAALSTYFLEAYQDCYLVNGIDITAYLRTQEVANASSIISAYHSVRAFLLPVQREFAQKQNTVCEGRDIGTTVFPKAEVKIFLTALPEVRAQRRFLELQPTEISFEQLQKQIVDRDKRDMSREISPLIQPEKSIVIDTSDLSIDQVIEEILSIAQGPRWEHFPHQADVGIRGIGKTISQAFEQAALALTAVITDLEKISLKKNIEVSCEAIDHEMLLVEWLNRIIYEMDCHQMLFSKFEVSIHDNMLSALLFGEKINQKRHKPAVEVKAATYNSLRVHCHNGGTWTAECVIDV